MKSNAAVLDELPAVILATGCAGGTISAVRQLAKSGVSVNVISSKLLCPAAWSRSTSRSYKGPSEKDTQKFLRRLLAIGKSCPGQVLLPTSDETAWLYTSSADVLSQYFRLCQPSVETMRRILDKKLLSDAVLKAGLAVLPTWEPRSIHEVMEAASTLLYPVLIKPRTHVHRLKNDKGVVAYSETELIEKYQTFLAREQLGSENRDLPDASIPLIQHFVDIGSEGVHSVSGYIDETGELFVTRHAIKVMQRSRPAGVGICFESIPTNQALSEGVRRLCRELNFFGIFEVEFIRFNDQWAVIDFNPRLFNQVGMDAQRGMPLAFLAYLDAAGKTSELRSTVKRAQDEDVDRPTVFYDRFTLWAILFAQTLTRRISSKDRSYWRSWTERHAVHSVDFALDNSDRMPGFIHMLSEIVLGIRACRRFFRSNPRFIQQDSQPGLLS